jgi:Zn-dependent peptidase ImmA (M78 family)/DNA-binding XRE family transcriptional regulator
VSIGERIKAARINTGLSQQKLADQLGLTKMAVSKYETGVVVPNSGVLIRLADLLDVNVDYFFRSTTVHLKEPSYRCKRTLGAKDEKKILGKTADWLERYLTVEEITGELKNLDLPEPDTCRVSSLDDIEVIARNLREEWNIGLDPIENLMEILEQHGIKVGVIDAPEKFDALTLWYNEECPVIIVNKTFPGDRQRFSLAHELGHLVLKIVGEVNEEDAAHRFAGAFLVPKEMAIAELGNKRNTLDFRELWLLKQKYRMSMNAWVHRAQDLGIITESAARRHYIQMAKMKWRKVEPWGQIESESPTYMDRLLLRALIERKISTSRFNELKGDGNPILAAEC